MKNPHFRLQYGTIYLYDGDKMITGYRRLAFGVDVCDPQFVTMIRQSSNTPNLPGKTSTIADKEKLVGL